MTAAIPFPNNPTEDMQKERPVVDGEFQRGESDPGFQLWMEVNKKVWGDLFTRKNAIGDHDVINTATPEKMMIIKDKYYFPNNSLLVICGDVKPDEAFEKAKKIFGDWESSGFDPHEKYPIPEFKPIEQTDYLIKESSIAQTPYTMYTWQGPDTRNDSIATLAADVFSTILGLNSSKWQQALVDKGLASYIGLNYQTLKFTGPVSVFAIPNPGKLKEFTAEVMKQVSHFADDDYFTDEQLQTAKEVLRRAHIRNTEKPSALASDLTYWWCSASLDYFTDYTPAMLNITRADIQKYLNKYIIGKPYVAGMIINEEMNSQLKPGEYFKNLKSF
jgi:zinc protease